MVAIHVPAPAPKPYDTKEYIARGRALLQPTPVRHNHLPNWLRVRLMKAYGAPRYSNSSWAVLDKLQRLETLEGRHLDLDHAGSVKQWGQVCFVSEPYGLGDGQLDLHLQVARRVRCGLELSANSWHYPTFTLRCTFYQPELRYRARPSLSQRYEMRLEADYQIRAYQDYWRQWPQRDDQVKWECLPKWFQRATQRHYVQACNPDARPLAAYDRQFDHCWYNAKCGKPYALLTLIQYTERGFRRQPLFPYWGSQEDRGHDCLVVDVEALDTKLIATYVRIAKRLDCELSAYAIRCREPGYSLRLKFAHRELVAAHYDREDALRHNPPPSRWPYPLPPSVS